MLKVAVVLVLYLAAADVACAEQPDRVAIPSVPGLTSPDTHPEACVSCHIRMDDIGVDARLSVALGEWERSVPAKVMKIAEDAMGSAKDLKGQHPSVALPLEDVPFSCISCHAATSSAPPFGRLIHLAHYRGGDENHFLSIFRGECTLCHKMDPTTGVWRIPRGSEK